ncbi:hypothetical protein CEXT_60581 [Caerostris extrusa]|uniref:DNA-directed DNA polymerase n=1 Tax=Caerostris extrusa TaxID=172846 RepID=A0AAV4S0Y9_CAEEX|nr:hypothetical protein CEXT_60581 [Caerostris extrusa]
MQNYPLKPCRASLDIDFVQGKKDDVESNSTLYNKVLMQLTGIKNDPFLFIRNETNYFTTAWARLKLYEDLDELSESVLYHDADSIMYASDRKNDPPLEISLENLRLYQVVQKWRDL